MKKIFYLVIFLSASLCAMEGAPLDKSLITLNAILDQLIIVLTSQPVVIGQAKIQLTQKQIAALQDKKSENFSSFIASFPEPPEGEDPTIFLFPSIDPLIFSYLADWQTTKSKLNRFSDRVIIDLHKNADALGMSQVVGILTTTFLQRHMPALSVDPLAWWEAMHTQLDLKDIEFNLSDLLPDLMQVIIKKSRLQLLQATRSLYFQPMSKYINLAVSDRGTPGVLYKPNDSFEFKEIPNCLWCRLGEFLYKHWRSYETPWSPNGQYISVVSVIGIPKRYDDPTYLRLYHWDTSTFEWKSLNIKQELITGDIRSWSPNSKYLLTENKDFYNHGSGGLSFTYQIGDEWQSKNVELKKDEIENDTSPILALAWSSDSRYCAVCSENQNFYVLEISDNKIETIFKYKINKLIIKLRWQPQSTLLAAGVDDGEIQLWDKKKNENAWELKQELVPPLIDKSNAKNNGNESYQIKWNFDGTSLVTYRNLFDKEDDALNIWEKLKDKWEIRYRLTHQEDLRPADVYWDSHNKLFSLLSHEGTKGSGVREILLWSRSGDVWNSTTIIKEQHPQKSLSYWDILYTAQGRFKALSSMREPNRLLLWNLNALNANFNFTLEESIPLIDWYIRVKRGEKVPLPEEFKDFGKL